MLGYDYAGTELGWDTVLYTIEPDRKLITSCNIAAAYGSLPIGEYVLCKPVQLTTSTGQTITKVYTVEFAIVD